MFRLAVLLCIVVFAGCTSLPTSPSVPAASGSGAALADGLYAEITTPRGVLRCELHFEKMPLTVASFVGLAEGSLGPAPRKPYFDGLTFHRVVPGFVVQGGDPTGTGSGGPGYRFPDEFAGGLRHDGPGILSMANSGPDTNGSQFFITLGEARYLDFVHSIFGRVVHGAEILPQLARGDAMTVKIIRQGRAAQRFRADEKSFNERLARAPRSRPPHFVDKSGTGSGGEHWQAKYLENRLANLARFTGRHIYVRLLDRFEPEPAGQTLEQYVADLATQQNLPAGAVLACFFADTDRWVLHGAPAKVTLPAIRPPEPPATPPTTLDGMAQQRQREIYRATGQVVSSLIDQTDPL
jgi:cyclophilin family peptidyl-prolyl cis-trans isomerase